MEFLSDRRFLANSLGHLVVDLFNSLMPILLAALSVPLALSNADIGMVATIYRFGGSLSQPLFGYLTDRFGGRGLAPGGVAWLLLFFSLAPLASGRWVLACVILAALGSGAYHPQGASKASQASLTHAATATAVFFLFGQIGLALGPAAGGVLIEALGLRGLWLPALLGLGVVALLAWNSTDHRTTQAGAAVDSGDTETAQVAPLRVGRYVLVVFALMIFLRSSIQAGTTTFLPKLFSERGMPPSTYGLLLSAFMAGSSLGNVMGGSLADRIGRKPVVVATLLLAVGPLLAYLQASGLVIIWLLIALTGALHGASHSIIVLIAQSMLPGRRALASGLILGFMFTSGAIGAFAVGVLADAIGLQGALSSLAGVSLAAGLLALALPSRSQVPGEEVARATQHL